MADREERKKLKRQAQSEAEMYAAWPEAAGVCAADKHPLDYKVNCSGRCVCAYVPFIHLHKSVSPSHTECTYTRTRGAYTHELLTCPVDLHPSITP